MKKPATKKLLVLSLIITVATTALEVSLVKQDSGTRTSLINPTYAATLQGEVTSFGEPAISEWSPIKLDQVTRDLTERRSRLDGEILRTQKLALPPTQKNNQLDILNRSLNLSKVESEVLKEMDQNEDGQIDLQEFNSKMVSLYERTYPLRHNSVESIEEGLYDALWNKLQIGSLTTISSITPTSLLLIVVEAGIYEDIKGSLNQYTSDLMSDGYSSSTYLCNDCTKEELKGLLVEAGKSERLKGAIFVGDLPVALYQDPERCGLSSAWVDPFPTDLYFMDLDGVWSGEDFCGTLETLCLSSHTGNTKAEIFIGRLAAPEEESEIGLINNYFNKNHNFKNGRSSLERRSLSFVDDPWEPCWDDFTPVVYPNNVLVTDPKLTSACEYRNQWKNGYENLLIVAHSDSFEHAFSDPALDCRRVTAWDVKELKPNFDFYNLMACSNALFTHEDYMAGWYVFQNSSHGLLAIGSTREMLNWDTSNFYRELRDGKNFGEAFLSWFNQDSNTDRKCAFGGMIIVGDPTLKPSPKPQQDNYPLRVFVTSEVYEGDLGNLAGADRKCQDLANQAGLEGLFTAWLSNDNVSARDRFHTKDQPYFLISKEGTASAQRIARDFGDLTDGDLENLISVDEHGSVLCDESMRHSESAAAWTGTSCSGEGLTTHNCDNWTATTSATLATKLHAAVGYCSHTNTEWSGGECGGFLIGDCASKFHLYCLEDLPPCGNSDTICPPKCPLESDGDCLTKADQNNDGVINEIDLAILLRDWNEHTSSTADLNQDGVTNGIDFSILRKFLSQIIATP